MKETEDPRASITLNGGGSSEISKRDATLKKRIRDERLRKKNN